VVQYVNTNFGGVPLGNTTVLILTKNVAIDNSADSNADFIAKWQENIDWGCQVGLVQSDVFDFVAAAAYLEERGVIAMLASGGRWTTNPNTNRYFKMVWNGAINSRTFGVGGQHKLEMLPPEPRKED